MNKTIISILLIIYSLLSFAQDTKQKNLLTGKISPEELSDILSSAKDWHPYLNMSETFSSMKERIISIIHGLSYQPLQLLILSGAETVQTMSQYLSNGEGLLLQW